MARFQIAGWKGLARIPVVYPLDAALRDGSFAA